MLLVLPVLCVAGSHSGPMLGQPATAADLTRWELTIDVTGRGLPAGSGKPAEGATIYREKCGKCHGPEGRGATAEELVGGVDTLGSDYPDRTLGSYWPYAPTIFDYIRRAMPIDAPFSLDNDEVYAVTAYLLYLNRLIPRDHTLNAESLSLLRMPNRHGFIQVYGGSEY
jgi:cytochrome c